MPKKKIQKLEFEDFVHVIPMVELEKTIEYHCGKREVKRFRDFMAGQTVSLLESQGGVYVGDFLRYLKERKRGIKKNFPLWD